MKQQNRFMQLFGWPPVSRLVDWQRTDIWGSMTNDGHRRPDGYGRRGRTLICGYDRDKYIAGCRQLRETEDSLLPMPLVVCVWPRESVINRRFLSRWCVVSFRYEDKCREQTRHLDYHVFLELIHGTASEIRDCHSRKRYIAIDSNEI